MLICKEVTSSALNRVIHDDVSDVLYVQFTKLKCWKYEHVNTELFEGFLNANSLGVFLNQNIKNLCPSSEIPASEFDDLWISSSNMPPQKRISLMDSIISAEPSLLF